VRGHRLRRELGQQWFDIIEPFADYAFNKSHAYGYGLVAYQTAYLKANYPAEYLRRCSPASRQPREGGGLPQRVPPWASRSRARRQPVGVDFTPSPIRRRRPTEPDRSRSGCRRCATWARAWSPSSSPSARPTALRRLLRLLRAGRPVRCSTSDHRVAHQGRRFDSLGHPRQGLLRCSSRSSTSTVARRKEPTWAS
jgi:hypothetical protein